MDELVKKWELKWEEIHKKNVEILRKVAPGAENEGAAEAVSPIMPLPQFPNWCHKKVYHLNLETCLSR
jgi:hypothetical protein